MIHWNKLLVAMNSIPADETELQLVEVKPDKTNEEKMRELLEKANAANVKLEERKKKASNQ